MTHEQTQSATLLVDSAINIMLLLHYTVRLMSWAVTLHIFFSNTLFFADFGNYRYFTVC